LEGDHLLEAYYEGLLMLNILFGCYESLDDEKKNAWNLSSLFSPSDAIVYRLPDFILKNGTVLISLL
jgi:hypothetical protein